MIMTITKKRNTKDWEEDRKDAMAQSIKESIEDEVKLEEEKEEYTITPHNTSSLLNNGFSGHTITTSPSSILTVAGDLTTTGTLTLAPSDGTLAYIGGADSYGTHIEDDIDYFSHSWEPISNITTFELALAMPYLIGDRQFYKNDPEMKESFSRHFVILDGESEEVDGWSD